MTPLGDKLARRIAAEGPIAFHDYMAACLTDPDHGYYARASEAPREKSPIGKNGDFITAPEISQVFGEVIGLCAGAIWQNMGSPAEARLIELGPGRGTLMADALRALYVLPDFLKSVAVDLVDTSPALRNAQGNALAFAACPIHWHARIHDVPDGPAILIANEFLDCLPVRQYVFDGISAGWRERLVGFRDGHFVFTTGGAAPPLAFPQEPENGAVVEARPGIAPLAAEFGRRGAKSPFAAIVIDYGYARSGTGDTTQAVLSHRFADILASPGEVDLSAHVDFADLGREAERAGLRAHGPMPMGEWLLRLGLELRVVQLLQGASEDDAAAIRSGVARLVHPAQMGMLFKVMALTSERLPPPPPFESKGRSAR